LVTDKKYEYDQRTIMTLPERKCTVSIGVTRIDCPLTDSGVQSLLSLEKTARYLIIFDVRHNSVLFSNLTLKKAFTHRISPLDISTLRPCDTQKWFLRIISLCSSSPGAQVSRKSLIAIHEHSMETMHSRCLCAVPQIRRDCAFSVYWPRDQDHDKVLLQLWWLEFWYPHFNSDELGLFR
jgi:hypothetical protein